MDGVGTPIIGRPRPLPRHDTPNPAYHPHTLNYEEPSNIRPMSMYATQDEILFKSGVEFDVIDHQRHPDGSYTIKLRQRK